MPMFTPEKALRDLPKTPVILAVILHGVDQERARTSIDGPGGWSVLEVLGHMNEMEGIYFERSQQIVESNLPKFPSFDQEAAAKDHRYNDQKLDDVFASYVSQRREHLAFLQGLTPDQWQRKGVHPSSGEVTLVEHATNTTLHDVNHIEQIVKALGISAPLSAL